MSKKDRILLVISVLMFLISGVILYFNFFAPGYSFIPANGPAPIKGSVTAGLPKAQILDNKTQSSYRNLDGPRSAWQALLSDPRFAALNSIGLVPVEIKPEEYGTKKNPFLPSNNPVENGTNGQ